MTLKIVFCRQQYPMNQTASVKVQNHYMLDFRLWL